jgi:hypothetical protein
MPWYAVRHLIQHEGLFEERVTLWSASSADEAIRRAEAEAANHANLLGSKSLSLFQSYELPGLAVDGAEIFSLLRRSRLDPEDYVDRFFDTGAEIQR